MPRSLDPALVVAVLALAFTCNASADESVQQDKLCEEMMSRVVQHAELNFEKSSDTIGTSARSLLDEIVEIAFDCPSLMISVTGHTDNTGNEASNRALSKARAESVVAYLSERGIDPGRLSAAGAGSDTPIASNEDATGRQENRRIEFEVTSR